MLFYGKTDVGRRRAVNQDNFIIRKYAGDVLFAVVCDGMGGANGGDTASAVAVEVFREQLDRSEREHPSFFGLSGDDILDILSVGVTEANREVFRMANGDPALTGMGTTLVGCVVEGDRVYAVNVGDSRMYAVKGGEIEQVSHDHSLVQYLVDCGRMTPEEAKVSTMKNRITRAVGTERTVGADFFDLTVEIGDRLILCSDGLTNHVEPEEIRDITAGVSPHDPASIQQAAENLIALANERGGTDNITAVILAV
ncbi:MAG: Stp1/IreP family PP2C-type Ser/Thr phosphatase [Ruminococcaceae bacterium]|jgi:protein phosphatase|nr:Stp1/IreP family PP2C-type Ser/Thr phosphatase [Oscillospiraceae bacterium]